MKNVLRHLIHKIQRFSRQIYFRYPFDKERFNIDGSSIRKIQSVLQPGDLIFRRFNNRLFDMLDGSFSEGALYLGKGKILFHTDENQIEMLDLIDYCICDKISIIRLKNQKNEHMGIDDIIYRAKSFYHLFKEYDFFFDKEHPEIQNYSVCIYCFKEYRLNFPKSFLGYPIKIHKTFKNDSRFHEVYYSESSVEL